jgi:predicted lipid-binding transport protein (Tim44 family)
MESSGWIEIIFLAMLAGFIGLRLYNVLGRRTGHEKTGLEKPAADPFRPASAELSRPAAAADGDADDSDRATVALPAGATGDLRSGIEAVASADRSFNPERFVQNAQAAYVMVLEAFWKGDVAAMEGLVSDDLHAQFKAAVDSRNESGERVENRLLQVDSATIVGAAMQGTMAEITVRFDSEIVSLSRDAAGTIVSGSESASVQTHDVWTFSRLTTSSDPAWLLIATDEDA